MNAITLTNMALQGVLLSAIGWALVRWCIRDARHRAWTALLALLVALIAPLIMGIHGELAASAMDESTPVPVSAWKPDWKISMPVATPVDRFPEIITKASLASSWTLTDLAWWTCSLWIAGSCAAALLLCILSLAAWRWRRSLRPPTVREMDLIPSSASRDALRVSEDEGSPCVVGLWQPVIAVPHRIFGKWSTRQWNWLLRHEGEHVRSRDTLIVWLLGWTKALVWWNPFVHALVEQWSQAREEICDRAAVSGEENSTAYSGFLLDIAASSRMASPMTAYMASSRPARRLRARMVAMLAQRPLRERASRVFQFGALATMIAVAVIVSGVGLKADDAPAKNPPKTEEVSTDVPTELKFVIGKMQFAPGDEIVIEKVSCSSPNFAAGDRVVVKGRYKLASVADANLSLFCTSITKGNGYKVPIFPEQTVLVQRGAGVFELAHTLPYEGRLHVSFYPSKGGSDLGGVYFGKEEAESSIESASATPSPQGVKFVTGGKRLATGDDIAIEKVSCSSPNFAVGDRVVVKGRYTLASVESARLSLHLTSTKDSGKWPVSPQQTTLVQRGNGVFELSHTIRTDGMLHVSFYPAEGGSDLGGVYFGTQEQMDFVTRSFASRKPKSQVGAAHTGSKAPALAHTLAVTSEIKRAFQAGDAIEIRQVTGTADKFQVGGAYRVTGVCNQKTLKNAALYLGNTAESGSDAIIAAAGSSLNKMLPNGTTEFDITFWLMRPGLLHVTIYNLDSPNKHDNAYAGIYLGDVVFKR